MLKQVLTTTVMLTALVCAAQAQLYTQDFTGADGTQPANWAVYVNIDNNDPGGLTDPAILNNEYYRSASTVHNGYYQSIAGYSAAGSDALTDMTVSARVKIDRSATANFTPTSAGVVARYDDTTTGMYQAWIQSSGSSNTSITFRLAKYYATSQWNMEYYVFSGGQADGLLDEDTAPGAAWGNYYTISLDAQGSDLVATLSDDVGVLSTLTAMDSSFTAGTGGLVMISRYRDTYGAATVYADDFSLDAAGGGVPGDTDGDGDVDLDDLFAVRNNFGTASGATLSDGDTDGDGDVDLDDLFAVRNNFGTGLSAVPEPLTLSLLAVGGLAILRRRCRQ